MEESTLLYFLCCGYVRHGVVVCSPCQGIKPPPGCKGALNCQDVKSLKNFSAAVKWLKSGYGPIPFFLKCHDSN